MRAHCKICREWDELRGAYNYHMAIMTDWIPSSGYDSNLREFKCPNCGATFYKLLTEDELLKAKEEAKLATNHTRHTPAK